MILQTSFDALTSPEFLTQELALVFVILLVIPIWASIRLYSTFGVLGWLFMVFSLLGSFLTNMPLIWFWLAVGVEAIILTLAQFAYTRARARQ